MLATLRSKGLRRFNSMKDKNNSPSFQILNSSFNSKNKIYLITSEITIIITTTIIIVIVIIKTNQHVHSTAKVFWRCCATVGNSEIKIKIWQRRTKVLAIYQV